MRALNLCFHAVEERIKVIDIEGMRGAEFDTKIEGVTNEILGKKGNE